jgi:hypothetical protein
VVDPPRPEYWGAIFDRVTQAARTHGDLVELNDTETMRPIRPRMSRSSRGPDIGRRSATVKYASIARRAGRLGRRLARTGRQHKPFYRARQQCGLSSRNDPDAAAGFLVWISRINPITPKEERHLR